jgi:hypothetical protein
VVPCRNEGCDLTWTFGRFEQLLFDKLGRPAPERACARCERFAKEHPAVDLACATCGAAVPWSTRAQLMAELGVWVKPELCAECKTREVRGESVPRVDEPGAEGAPRATVLEEDAKGAESGGLQGDGVDTEPAGTV